jgi:hypothetical protein
MKKILRASRTARYLITSALVIHVLCNVSVLAQDINNQANVYIPNGMTVYTVGNLINTGFLQNNGFFSLTGNWNNTSVYQGSGTISLDGTNQSLENNNQFIANLAVNGGGIKTISHKISISNEIDFNEGIILVRDIDTLMLSESCNVLGGSEVSYTEGALSTMGTGSRLYPIGKNGKYHPASLMDIKGLSPVIEMEVEENLPTLKTSPASTLMTDIYWIRKTISGTFESSPIDLTYTLNDTINHDRVAIAQGQDLTDALSLLENVSLTSSGTTDVIGSRKEATGIIFAIAEVDNDPAKPYYLSTTLSPSAVNPENRSIKLFGDGISEDAFRFQVFNRWGITIFETQSLTSMQTSGWDGNQRGSIVSSGAYPYSLHYLNSSGMAIQQTGFIMVIR